MIELDARGLRCPWPVLRLARALRDSDCVAIRADDPDAAREITAAAVANGWSLAEVDHRIVVRRAPNKDCFTVAR